MSEEKVPVIGGAVLVTFYNGTHELSSVVAHVLAITGAAAGLATADGHPALTVAYPDPTADPSILSSANWQRAYVRKTGVVHFSHQSAVDGQQSIVWGYPVPLDALPTLIKPTGPASNPALERQIVGAKGTEMQIDDTVRLRSELEPVPVMDPTSTESTGGQTELSTAQGSTASTITTIAAEPVPAETATTEATPAAATTETEPAATS